MINHNIHVLMFNRFLALLDIIFCWAKWKCDNSLLTSKEEIICYLLPLYASQVLFSNAWAWHYHVNSLPNIDLNGRSWETRNVTNELFVTIKIKLHFRVPVLLPQVRPPFSYVSLANWYQSIKDRNSSKPHV